MTIKHIRNCLFTCILCIYPLVSQATQQLEIGGQYAQLLGANGNAGFGWLLGYGLGGKLSNEQRLYGLLQIQQIMGLAQEGEIRLGHPSVERNRWNFGLEARNYRLIWKDLHLLVGVRVAYIHDESELKFQALSPIIKETSGFELGFNLGLLYRLSDRFGIQSYWSPSYLIDREGLQLAEKDVGIEENKRHNGISRFMLSGLIYF